MRYPIVSTKSKAFHKKNATKDYVKDIVAESNPMKYLERDDLVSNSVGAGSAAILRNLCQIPAGDGDGGQDERVGSTVRAKYLRIRGYLIGADSSNAMRLMVLRTKGIEEADVTLDDLPGAATAGQGTVTAPLQSLDSAFRRKFTVKYDKVHILNSGSGYSKAIDIKIKCNDLLTFTSDAATSGVNTYYLFAVSDSTVAANPGLTFVSKLSYVD